MNWTEDYRPNKLEDIIGQHDFVEDALGWVRKNRMPNVLFYGPPGTGKTSAAIVLAKTFLGEDFSTNFLEINASQDRRLETVRETIGNFLGTKSVSGQLMKFVLLDEIEGMTKDSQRALKRTMERTTRYTIFLITCNDIYGVQDALKSRCANYLFHPLPAEVQAERLAYILEQNSYEFSEETEAIVEKIVDNCGGDFRRAINETQACIYSGRDVQEMIDSTTIHYKNSLQRLFDGDPQGMTYLSNLVKSGYNVKDICNKLLQSVMDMDLSNARRFKTIATIGEMEWRSRSVTPKVLIAWFCSQIMNQN